MPRVRGADEPCETSSSVTSTTPRLCGRGRTAEAGHLVEQEQAAPAERADEPTWIELTSDEAVPRPCGRGRIGGASLARGDQPAALLRAHEPSARALSIATWRPRPWARVNRCSSSSDSDRERRARGRG